MKKTCFLMALVMLLAVLPLTALADTMYVVTPNGGSVNLREGPDSNSDVLTSIGYGEAVHVIDGLMGSSWANVEYDGYYGFIMWRYLMDYIPPVPAPTSWPTFVPAPTYKPTARPNPRPTAKPNNNNSLENTLAGMFSGFVPTSYQAVIVPSTPTTYVNMRWAPSKSAPVRTQYWAGTVLQVLSENGGWCEVYDAQNRIHGFVMSNFLSTQGVGVSADS